MSNHFHPITRCYKYMINVRDCESLKAFFFSVALAVSCFVYGCSFKLQLYIANNVAKRATLTFVFAHENIEIHGNNSVL